MTSKKRETCMTSSCDQGFRLTVIALTLVRMPMLKRRVIDAASLQGLVCSYTHTNPSAVKNLNRARSEAPFTLGAASLGSSFVYARAPR